MLVVLAGDARQRVDVVLRDGDRADAPAVEGDLGSLRPPDVPSTRNTSPPLKWRRSRASSPATIRSSSTRQRPP